MTRTKRHIVLLAALGSSALFHAAQAAPQPPDCARVLRALGNQLLDASCVASTDLTTNNPATTPADNSLPGLPPFAYTPTADRAVLVDLVSNPPLKTPISTAVPGLQISARIASDPLKQARFLLRLPTNWNGRLVVAGASAQRSEHNGDFAWSDYVLQKGYAYASQNKGTLNFALTTATDPLGCRLNPSSSTYVHFYDDEPGQAFTRWTQFMVEAARLAREGVRGAYGHGPRFTYAVGTSNGGYQVRRAVEVAPHLFDGGVDSEGTFVDEQGPNLLTQLPQAVLNMPDYISGGLNAASTAARNIRAAGFPPDIAARAPQTDSFWQRHANAYWELTLCQWQKRLDPSYDTYGAGLGQYIYSQRLSRSDVDQTVEAIATTGRIQRPLITVVGTMDGLLPIDHHARAYARAVAASTDARKGSAFDGGDAEREERWERSERHRKPAYRLYEVQNGNHIESYKAFYPQLEYLLPHTHRAFDLLVSHVEQGTGLPPDQCIARGAVIEATPRQAGHCTDYLVGP